MQLYRRREAGEQSGKLGLHLHGRGEEMESKPHSYMSSSVIMRRHGKGAKGLTVDKVENCRILPLLYCS